MKVVTTAHLLDEQGSTWLLFQCSACGILALVEDEDAAHRASQVHLAGAHGYLSPV